MTPPESGREQLMSRAFVMLADTLVDDYDVIEMLTRLVGYSVALLDADAAGIMLADPGGELRSVAFSDEDARLVELMELQADQGPCMDCYRTGRPVTVVDLTQAAPRWPGFVAAATADSVFLAVHALPLRLRGEAIGALNLFRHHAGRLSAADAALGQALADVATIAILQDRAIHRAEVLTEQLQAALNSRVVIEQAKGVLAQHAGIPMDQAFDRLRRYARAHNTRLAQVARALAEATLHPDVVITG